MGTSVSPWTEDLAHHAGEDINSLAPGDATWSFSEHPHERPVCLQAFVPPHLDLRYITTYVCDAGEVGRCRLSLSNPS